jgi:hypothetical protein
MFPPDYMQKASYSPASRTGITTAADHVTRLVEMDNAWNPCVQSGSKLVIREQTMVSLPLEPPPCEP